jgi:hypothetical protein
MTDCLLLWALPDTWLQFELLAPDVEEHLDAEMRRRFEGTGVEEEDLARVITLQAQTLRESAADGIVLLATRAEEGGSPGEPPPGLSLTLALANRPTSGSPGEEGSEGGRSSGVAAFISEASPLLLDDAELSAFTRESRAEVPVAGIEKPLTRFQAQAFVLPKGQAGMAVITVTTFDPAFENEARDTARGFANTLCFVTADDEDDESPP